MNSSKEATATSQGSKKGTGGLSGLKCLELGSFISAAYCSKLMADVGMEVIKIEEPDIGDSARPHGPFPDDIPHSQRSGLFAYLNCNKMGITLNLKEEEGRDIFRRLVSKVDVLVENYPPHIIKEYGLAYEILSELNPELVMTSITPFGQEGLYRDHKAYAINCAAAGGISNIVGDPLREPLSPPLSFGHYQSGTVAAIASLVAIIQRKLTGMGQHVDVSEVDVWATLHAGLLVHRFVFNGAKRSRAGHRTPGIYPYTILPCQDGYMSMIAILGTHWKRFLELLGGGNVPDWYAKSSRFRDRRTNSLKYADELDDLLAPWLMAHTKEEIFTMCQQNHVPFAPVRRINEVAEDGHLAERGYFVEVDQPQMGRLRFPGAPCKFSKTEWGIRHPAPELGEHNEKVLCDLLGYSRYDLPRLKRAGVI